MNEDFSEMEKKLKYFILYNEDFFNLAKKYTFIYNEFSPYIDYCEIRWNRKKKVWEYVGYYRHNQNEKMPVKKKKPFFLNLSINEYNWARLLSELEIRFNNYLEKVMNEKEIINLVEKDHKKYVDLKDEFFKKNKNEVIENLFKLNEKTIEKYFKKTVKRLRKQQFKKI